MVGTILGLTTILYYIHMSCMAQYKFNKSNRTLTPLTMACLPFYVLKTAIKAQGYAGLTLLERFGKVIKVLFRQDIYVAVLQEILEFYTNDRERVTVKHLYNTEVDAIYNKFLREGV